MRLSQRLVLVSGSKIKVGTQIDRIFSAPIGGLTSLTTKEKSKV